MSLFISNEVKLDFNDVMIVPRFGSVDSRSKVKLDREFVTPHSQEILTGPGIIAANMDGVGTFEVAEVLRKRNIYTALHKNYSSPELISFFRAGMETDEDHGSDTSFYSLGISDSEFDRLNAVNKQVPITRICIDVANGYMAQFYDFIKLVREFYPYATIMAGNVVTPEAVIALYDAGADIAKMGIGPGAVCTTRIVTGVGYPQLSCILDSFAAADSVGIGLCSDGGCTSSGDVSKAIVAGADFVMLGTMLAGTTEGGGTVDEDGNITFYGMSSETANNKHFGGLKNYRSSEGRTISIPHKGSMNEVISQVLGGVVSSCTYTGSLHLSNLPANGQFVRVNNVYNRSVERYTVGN